MQKEVDKLQKEQQRSERKDSEEDITDVAATRRELKEEPIDETMKQLLSYRFMNQLLVQQLAQERRRVQSDLTKELEAKNNALMKELEATKKENEELKMALSKTDLTDYQFIEDSSEESVVS